MKLSLSEKNWRRFFYIATFIKGFDGVLGMILGTMLLFINKVTLTNDFAILVGGELLEQPRDFFVNYFYQLLQHLSITGKTFAGLYILSHGLLNLILVIGLYKNKLWAYWCAVGFVGIFILYLLYRFSYTHSGGTALLIVFDLLFVILAWHEYRFHKKQLLVS